MAYFSMPIFFILLTFLFFYFNSLIASQSSSFYLTKFDKDPTFDAFFALYGDAEVVVNESSLQLTRSVSSSSGWVMFKNPVKVVEGNPASLVSFSTNFSFSLSPESGDGLAFVMVPSGFNASVVDGKNPFGVSLGSKKSTSGFEVVAVEFDTLRDSRFGDLNDNHVGIDVGGFVSVRAKNVSSLNVVLNSGKKSYSWIDYEASSRRIEVRLSESSAMKPVDPLLSYPFDFSKMWNGEELMVGLSSSNGNSSQTCFVYSWSFKTRTAPHWMHSHPLDPKAFAGNEKAKSLVVVREKRDCLFRVVAAMIFGTGFGALGAFMVLYLWTIFGNRRPVAPEECSVHPVDFEYEKFKVVDDKVATEDGKK